MVCGLVAMSLTYPSLKFWKTIASSKSHQSLYLALNTLLNGLHDSQVSNTTYLYSKSLIHFDLATNISTLSHLPIRSLRMFHYQGKVNIRCQIFIHQEKVLARNGVITRSLVVELAPTIKYQYFLPVRIGKIVKPRRRCILQGKFVLFSFSLSYII